MLQVTPDWSMTGTMEDFSKECAPTVFDGPGLYLHNTTTALVMPESMPPDGVCWRHRWPKDAVFRLYVWGVPFHQTILSRADAPVRVDDRE